MREELLHYYERELTYLRQMGASFARKNPAIAGRLLLEADDCQDPHVERLLEGFAFLAARVHRRIDDDFPELTDALLKIIHPSYLRPLPSMTIVECRPDPGQGKKTAVVRIPRGTELVSKLTVNQLPCQFRTAYDVDLWPFAVEEAEWRLPERMQRPVRASNGDQVAAAARLRLRCQGDATFAGLPVPLLRFHLAGDVSVYSLYELLSRNCIEVHLRDPKDVRRLIVLPPSQIRMAGFDPEEALLPYDRRSVEGHRLLQEYFAFPEKFLFFDLDGLEQLATAGFQQEVEIVFLFSKFERPERQQALELSVNARTFRLSCTPAINLFLRNAEPILLSQAKHEYTIVPDSRNVSRMEIFSIEEVVATNPRMRKFVTLEPMHTYRFQTRLENKLAFWTATRHQNELGDTEPSVMTISTVDLNGQITDPEADVLKVRMLCTNFNFPDDFKFGGSDGDFEAVGYPAAKTVTVLRRPTQTVSPPIANQQVWRLISLLSLNYLSLCESGRTALQEILRLHNFTGAAASENQIGAISSLRSSPHFTMIESSFGLVPARGTLVEMELDEQQFAGGGAYLFGSVLDRFLAGYCSMNSFTQLTARTNQRKEEMARWSPRAGAQVLV